MKKRALGKTGIEIAPLAFGGNVFGWTINERTSFELLDAFIEAGFSLIDTADSYSRWVPGNKGGESEEIIGKWIKSRSSRQKVVIATKVGSDMGLGRSDLSVKWIIQEVEDSLTRLQTDYIDLYQAHFDDVTTPVEETMNAFSKLVKEGKVRMLGASNFELDRLEASLEYTRQHQLPGYQALQPEYNLYAREKFETTYLPLCRSEKLQVLPYFALASGFLTGKYRTFEDAVKSARGEGIVKKYLNERGLRILTALDIAAEKLNASPTSVSLAWLMTQPTVLAPIASATSIKQLKEIMHAAMIRLDEESIKLLTEASAYN